MHNLNACVHLGNVREYEHRTVKCLQYLRAGRMVMQQSLNELFRPDLRSVEGVDEPIDRNEVLRYLGYPEGVAPNERIAGILDDWIDQASRIAAPRAIYRVLPVVDKNRKSLRVETTAGFTEFRGAIGEYLGPSLSIAVFIATAGPQVERLASKLLREGDDLGAMVLNAVGAERAEAAEAVVIRQLREMAGPAGLAPTLPYSPGYCGMKLVEQRKLFSLLDTQWVGVTLTPDCLMQPIKSVSGLIGLGLAADVVTTGSSCDRCEHHNCNMRR